ncbi:MAG: Txe/YoeB family addiction module toxin [Rhizobiaceae bacterium]
MRLIFSETAWDEYQYWQTANPKLTVRINALLKECLRTPFHGTGKPEPLRGDLKGYWSRRIDQQHRLVYQPTNDGLLVAKCRSDY